MKQYFVIHLILLNLVYNILVPLQIDVDEAEHTDKSNQSLEHFEPDKTSIRKRSYHKREEDFLRMNHLTRFGGSDEGYEPAILGRRKRNKMPILNYLSQLKDLRNNPRALEAILNKYYTLEAY